MVKFGDQQPKIDKTRTVGILSTNLDIYCSLALNLFVSNHKKPQANKFSLENVFYCHLQLGLISLSIQPNNDTPLYL